MALKTDWVNYVDEVTAAFLNDLGTQFNAVQSALSTVPSGASLVTLAGTQTLTNKTLTSPRVDTSILDANGNALFSISANGSAVNYFQVVNRATGGSPELNVVGADANIGFVIRTKGSGAFQLYPATGQSAVIQVLGADANHNLNLIPKGTGRVNITNLTTGSSAELTAPKIISAIYDSNGAPIIALNPVASAVNYVRIRNSNTGVRTVIESVGADTNISMLLYPKGAGTVDITNLVATNPRLGPIADLNGNGIISLNGLPNAVNHVRIQNAGTGATPWILPNGSDANISLSILAKGDGGILFRDGRGSGAHMLVVTSVASAVNYLQVNSAATVAAPIISSQGSDANIGIRLQPKGTGNVEIYGSTAQPPGIQAVGVDANVPLVLASKGTGGVTLQAGPTSIVAQAGSGVLIRRDNTAINAGLLVVTSAGLNGSSGVAQGLVVNPTIAQSGTAGYALLVVDAVESTIGSGDRFLADFRVGGIRKAVVDANGAIGAMPVTTAGRPAASSVRDGAMMYDTTLNKPIWSDGTVWRDAAGTAV